MAYSGLPNGNITWAANELVTSAKMNLFSANQADIAQYLMNFDPNDGVLTIQVNGTTVGTFTADDASNVTVDLPIPTTVAELSDASSYALASAIPTNVSQLNNDAGYVRQVDVNTVNDAVLDIQKNGNTIATFTANSSTNQTANLIIPVNVTDLADATSYYTKAQTDAAISTAVGAITQQTVTFEIVQNLPTTGISTTTVYMKKESGNNYYDQWMYINNQWQHLGTTEVDMSEYAKLTDIPTVPAVYDSTIRIENYDHTLIDSFSTNQASGQTITLPSPMGTLDTALNPSSSNAVTNAAICAGIKDATITLKDAAATTIGSFTTNQASNADITLPTASGTNYGLVKIVTSTTDIGEGAALTEGTIYCVVSA
jgi:hypothetical protein